MATVYMITEDVRVEIHGKEGDRVDAEHFAGTAERRGFVVIHVGQSVVYIPETAAADLTTYLIAMADELPDAALPKPRVRDMQPASC